MEPQQNVRLEGKSTVWKWLIPLLILAIIAGLIWAYYINKTTTPTNTFENYLSTTTTTTY